MKTNRFAVIALSVAGLIAFGSAAVYLAGGDGSAQEGRVQTRVEGGAAISEQEEMAPGLSQNIDAPRIVGAPRPVRPAAQRQQPSVWVGDVKPASRGIVSSAGTPVRPESGLGSSDARESRSALTNSANSAAAPERQRAESSNAGAVLTAARASSPGAQKAAPDKIAERAPTKTTTTEVASAKPAEDRAITEPPAKKLTARARPKAWPKPYTEEEERFRQQIGGQGFMNFQYEQATGKSREGDAEGGQSVLPPQ